KVLNLPPDGLPVEVRELHAISSDYRQVSVGKKEDVARVIKNCGYVRGDEILVIAQADHCRRTIARSYDLVWLVHIDDRQSKDPRQLFHRPADRLFERGTAPVACLQQMFLDQVRNDLGFRL